MSYDIIHAHNGAIRVDTQEGEGSVFTVELPIMGAGFNKKNSMH
jgi:signal transduction histidine kinase